MAFDDRQLAALLQTTRDFARDMLEQTGALIPFGGQVKPDGEFEFFVLAQPGEQLTREDAYRQIETALAERAGRGDILAGVIAPPLRLVPIDVRLDLSRPRTEGAGVPGQLRDLAGLGVQRVPVLRERGPELRRACCGQRLSAPPISRTG